MRQALLLLSVALPLAACRKPEPPPPVPVAVSPAPGAPVPAPPPVVEATPVSKVESAAEPKQGNWWSLKAPGEKQETMEGWLYQHSTGNAATKAEIVKQVQHAKLSPADKAMLEGVRARLKLPPMPMQ